MPKGISDRTTLTDERDLALFEEYQKVLLSYGETARYMAKSRLYEEAAKKFFISPKRAQLIINEMMRKKSKDMQCLRTTS
jgi:hypothetical protein